MIHQLVKKLQSSVTESGIHYGWLIESVFEGDKKNSYLLFHRYSVN